MTVYVIGEAGSCGDKDIVKMLQQVDSAAESGVDAVKFQWCSDGQELAERRGSLTDGYGDIYANYLQWPDTWHPILADRCRERNVEYLCSTYLSQDVEVVAPFVDHFKIASFEASDREFIDAHKPYTKDDHKFLIISTGMSSSADLDAVRKACSWLPHGGLVLLHCTSAYPAPITSMNLEVIREEHLDGYSDHTEPAFTQTGALAAAAGAEFIEAHFRLPTTDRDNPDVSHAMVPTQLSEYVKWIRVAEQALGASAKTPQVEEQPMLKYKRVI